MNLETVERIATGKVNQWATVSMSDARTVYTGVVRKASAGVLELINPDKEHELRLIDIGDISSLKFTNERPLLHGTKSNVKMDSQK